MDSLMVCDFSIGNGIELSPTRRSMLIVIFILQKKCNIKNINIALGQLIMFTILSANQYTGIKKKENGNRSN